MRCFLPSWWTQTKSDHSRQQSRNHLGPPAIENCVPDKVFIFVYFWTGTVMLGSLACVPVNYVHRQPALFLHKVILTIYFSDISRCIKSLKIFQDIFFRNFKILYINGSVNYVHRQPASFCTE